MKYFSGFCFKNEQEIFKEFLEPINDFTVAGFSKGAINALKYSLNAKERIDRLVLLSPAFFNDKDEKFIRLQLLNFKKDRLKYIDNFFKNIGLPKKYKKYTFIDSKEELEFLLTYKFKKEELEKIVKKGIKIEVFIGSNDKIIEPNKAIDFFKEYATIYQINRVGHLLI